MKNQSRCKSVISDLADHLLQFSSQQNQPAFFVTGTDTGVGKTFVTCFLIKELQRRKIRAGAFKPICCGNRKDARKFWELTHREVPLHIINPVYLKQPVAPLSQPCPSWSILCQKVLKAFSQYKALNFEIILAEGAGGLLCPVTKKQTMRELAKVLGLPILIVACDHLGVLNHSLLTYEALMSKKLSCAAGVLNGLRQKKDSSQKSNGGALKSLLPIPFYTL